MSISSNFFKKNFHTLCVLKLDVAQCVSPILAFVSTRVPAHNTSGVPNSSRPELNAAPPVYMPDVPPEPPPVTDVSEFDRIPMEKPADPPPLSPGPNPGPEFPGPPSPSPPTPDGPRPPLPSPPGEPQAFPPHGPDVIPPKPPEPGPPRPIKPDVPPPFMGSDGLVFY